MIVMAATRIALVVGVGALIAAPLADGATITTGSPKLADYGGTPVAVVFFHPL